MASARSRRPDPDWTDTEAEGEPDIDEQPPGYDAETAVEGTFTPHDQPLGANEVGVTAHEEELGDSVADRQWRENPDVSERDIPRSAFEEEERLAGRLVAPAEGGPVDDDDEVAEVAEDPGGLSAEEAAIHLSEE